MRIRPSLLLFLPFIFYIIPFLLGYSWNAINPGTPLYSDFSYNARWSDTAITIETSGSGVVAVPFMARLKQYLRQGDLPLWNPYQGLGQPFAAQGEGSPFSPFTILRALLPYTWENAITIGLYFLSSIQSIGKHHCPA